MGNPLLPLCQYHAQGRHEACLCVAIEGATHTLEVPDLVQTGQQSLS